MNAVRRDIADVALAADVFAPHYAKPLIHGCAIASAPLLAGPSAAARAVSELLLGEGFAVVDVGSGWAWGYGLHDHYVGYLPLASLGTPLAATHRVAASAALVFAEADIKTPVVTRLPMGARVSGEAAGNFVAAAGGFVHRRHLCPIDAVEADFVAVAERLLGAPYRWGGRGGDGVDCSGLVQLALSFAGIAAPRDSDQQQAIGAPLTEDEPLRRGDLVFFPGHVGIMADDTCLLHANAHWMATVREPLADVIARLLPAHGQPVTARRRPA